MAAVDSPLSFYLQFECGLFVSVARTQRRRNIVDLSVVCPSVNVLRVEVMSCFSLALALALLLEAAMLRDVVHDKLEAAKRKRI